MTHTLSYDEQDGIARAIISHGKIVQDCFFDRIDKPQQTGAIHQGTVDRILSGKGAFIKIAGMDNGYLNDSDGLHSGQKIWVQIKNEPREGKAVSLTKNVTLPGVFLVHQPFITGVHVSRRLADMGEETGHLTKALAGKEGGWVLRSSALKASRTEIEQEAVELSAAAQHGLTLPALNAFEQALLNAAGNAAGNMLQVFIEKDVDLERITPYIRAARPSLLAAIRLTPTERVFDQNDLEGFYASLCNAIVPLPRGGNIKFERTDTMNIIDVNGGERTHFLEINRDAAQIVMNHIRWRNLGGIILIDFLKMKRAYDRDAITDILDANAQHDINTCDVFGFTRLGICEISRARRGYSLPELKR